MWSLQLFARIIIEISGIIQHTLLDELGGVAGDDILWFNIFYHNCACLDHRIIANSLGKQIRPVFSVCVACQSPYLPATYTTTLARSANGSRGVRQGSLEGGNSGCINRRLAGTLIAISVLRFKIDLFR